MNTMNHPGERLEIYIHSQIKKPSYHEKVIKNLMRTRRALHDMWDLHDNVFVVGVLNEKFELYLRAKFFSIQPWSTINGLSVLEYNILRDKNHRVRACNSICSRFDISVREVKFFHIDEYTFVSAYENTWDDNHETEIQQAEPTPFTLDGIWQM